MRVLAACLLALVLLAPAAFAAHGWGPYDWEGRHWEWERNKEEPRYQGNVSPDGYVTARDRNGDHILRGQMEPGGYVTLRDSEGRRYRAWVAPDGTMKGHYDRDKTFKGQIYPLD